MLEISSLTSSPNLNEIAPYLQKHNSQRYGKSVTDRSLLRTDLPSKNYAGPVWRGRRIGHQKSTKKEEKKVWRSTSNFNHTSLSFDKYNHLVINGHNLLQLRYEQTYKYDVLHSEKALLALDLNILTVDRMHHCTPLQSAIIAFCI